MAHSVCEMGEGGLAATRTFTNHGRPVRTVDDTSKDTSKPGRNKELPKSSGRNISSEGSGDARRMMKAATRTRAKIAVFVVLADTCL